MSYSRSYSRCLSFCVCNVCRTGSYALKCLLLFAAQAFSVGGVIYNVSIDIAAWCYYHNIVLRIGFVVYIFWLLVYTSENMGNTNQHHHFCRRRPGYGWAGAGLGLGLGRAGLVPQGWCSAELGLG
jgi:hypothetical protein